MSNIAFSERSFEEYLYWQLTDKSILKKLNALLKDIQRNGMSEGLGKPEPLKHRKAWSRRINHEHRLVYRISTDGAIEILSCKGHYDD